MQYLIVRFPVQTLVDITANPVVPPEIKHAEISAMKVYSDDGIRLILVARDDETALLMNNTFLPSQTKELNFIKTKAFYQGMMRAMREKK